MQNKKSSINSSHYIFTSILFSFSYVLINQWNKYQQIQCSVSFTPYENCTQKIVDEINKAKNEILIQTYSFTSKPIIEALINKHKNGIKIIIIADNSQKNSIILVKLKNHGIPIYIDKLPGIAHNKVMIIDNNIVLTGSFNFTESAQYRNAENSLIIISKKIASKYKNNFKKRLKISTEYNKFG